jgi:hypothetical protein
MINKLKILTMILLSLTMVQGNYEYPDTIDLSINGSGSITQSYNKIIDYNFNGSIDVEFIINEVYYRYQDCGYSYNHEGDYVYGCTTKDEQVSFDGYVNISTKSTESGNREYNDTFHGLAYSYTISITEDTTELYIEFGLTKIYSDETVKVNADLIFYNVLESRIPLNFWFLLPLMIIPILRRLSV